jgi:hypothetical protein
MYARVATLEQPVPRDMTEYWADPVSYFLIKGLGGGSWGQHWRRGQVKQVASVTAHPQPHPDHDPYRSPRHLARVCNA